MGSIAWGANEMEYDFQKKKICDCLKYKSMLAQKRLRVQIKHLFAVQAEGLIFFSRS